MKILMWLAILPSVLLAVRVLAYDRIEKEPLGLLVKLFLLGAASCLPAGIIEALFEDFLIALASSATMASALVYLVLVPAAEEGMKYLVLRTTRKSREFNYTFDGIVYGTMVGLGFATLENVLYVLDSMSLGVALMRGVLSVPLHCTCGIFMGYFYGVARGQEARGVAREAGKARRLALLVPCLIHGIYDFSLDTDSVLVLIAGIAFTLLIFWIAARQVRLASANDAPIMVSLSELKEATPPERPGDYFWSNKGTPPPPFNG